MFNIFLKSMLKFRIQLRVERIKKSFHQKGQGTHHSYETERAKLQLNRLSIIVFLPSSSLIKIVDIFLFEMSFVREVT